MCSNKNEALRVDQEKNPFCVIMGEKNLFFTITICHHLAGLVMPIDDPLDAFFYPTVTHKMDSYNLIWVCTFMQSDQHLCYSLSTKIVSEYDQEIPQSHTADYPMALRGRAVQPSQDNRKTN